MNLRSRPLELALVTALVLGFASCGGSGDPYKDGQQALNSGDYKSAVKSFDEALAQMKPEQSTWLGTKQAQIEALAHVDQARAQKEALELLKTHKDALGEKGARAVASDLVRGGACEAAFKFLEATIDIWPNSPDLDAVWGQAEARAKQDAKQDPSQLKNLQGLGYVGGDAATNSGKRQKSKPPAEKTSG
jgi:hypothetical protein